jgi:hypothetical protein
MCQVWSSELERLGSYTTGVGRATSWGASLYRAVDEAVIPILGW